MNCVSCAALVADHSGKALVHQKLNFCSNFNCVNRITFQRRSRYDGWRKAWGEPVGVGAVQASEVQIFLCLNGQGVRECHVRRPDGHVFRLSQSLPVTSCAKRIAPHRSCGEADDLSPDTCLKAHFGPTSLDESFL